MLPAPCSSFSNSQRSDIRRRVRKAQRDAMVDLVNSTIDVFLSKPCEDPQVLTIRIPDINVTVAELTPDEASLIVNNPHYDKMLEAAENKKRVHAACAAARQFLVEHSITKNPFPPELQKAKGVPASLPKPDRVDLPTFAVNGMQGKRAGLVLHPRGISSTYSTSGSNASSSVASSGFAWRSSTDGSAHGSFSDENDST